MVVEQSGVCADYKELEKEWSLSRKKNDGVFDKFITGIKGLVNRFMAIKEAQILEGELLCEMPMGWDTESAKKFVKTIEVDVNKKGAFDKIRDELKKKGIDAKYIDGMTASIIDAVKGTTKWRGKHED